jgi:hypothetical protein
MPTVPPLIVPTQSDAQTSLRAFLLDVMPVGTAVVLGQPNRVPEPAGSAFVVMTPILIKRLGTNRGTGFDVKFTGSVTGNVLTVTAVQHGAIILNSLLYGVGLENLNVRITSQLTGVPGGIGTYQLGTAPNLSSETLASGYWQYLQPAELTVQMDFHAADMTAGDMAMAASTLFRSEYATRFFANLGPDVTPLYADDPAQRPFLNDQQQIEWRWVLDARMQVNDIAQIGQQFADAVVIRRVMVDAPYPLS